MSLQNTFASARFLGADTPLHRRNLSAQSAMQVRIIELSALPSELIDRFDSGDGLIWARAGVSAKRLRGKETTMFEVSLPPAGRLQTHLKRRTTPPHPIPETLAELAGLHVFQHGRPRLNCIIRAA